MADGSHSRLAEARLGRGCPAAFESARRCRTPALESLIARVPDAQCVGVDTPIGLPALERDADLLTRNYVGRDGAVSS